MANSVTDTRKKLMDRYYKQVAKGEAILKKDPSLTNDDNLNNFKNLLREMSLDLKSRKEDISKHDEIMNKLESEKELRKGGVHMPPVDPKELHEKKLKQLADLEEGLKINKKKTMMLLGMSMVLLFLQAGSFVFM